MDPSRNQKVLELNIKENTVSTGCKEGNPNTKVVVIW